MAATRDVARASLYRGPINLWVEDELTRAYLSAVWDNPAVAFFIGGGNEGVRAIVKDAEESGFPNVFALVDRDFFQTNKPSWSALNKTFRTFVLPVHEIENYLLDPSALASSRFNNLRKTESEIDGLMGAAAGRLCWWAACREVVAELRNRFRRDFIKDPSFPPVNSEAEALNHISGSPWFKKLARETARTTETDIRHLLTDAHARSNGHLADGSWRSEFAGKEILRDVGSRICDRPRMPNQTLRGAEFDTDLAKGVGAWQRQNNAIPPDLVELLQALQLRIARPPAGP